MSCPLADLRSKLGRQFPKDININESLEVQVQVRIERPVVGSPHHVKGRRGSTRGPWADGQRNGGRHSARQGIQTGMPYLKPAKVVESRANDKQPIGPPKSPHRHALLWCVACAGAKMGSAHGSRTLLSISTSAIPKQMAVLIPTP